jgi:lipoprotein-anchoring transpeptidase ErfK/SrfK
MKYETPTGKFVITDKHRSRVSSIYDVEMPYFMRLSCSAVGMHAGSLPGYPASHGCIRMPAEAAREMFKIVEVGTLVSISR